MKWKYAEGWDEETLLDGSYCGFVYMFEFEDGTVYYGSKQLYKRVKDKKMIKVDSVENNWRDYTSSSNLVNSKIANGEKYSKTILYAFQQCEKHYLLNPFLSLISY
jgi:rhamnogalacturonyl hydrolase YesR